MKQCWLILLFGMLLAAPPAHAALTYDNDAQRLLEEQGMAWLTVTREQTRTIAPFVSDGCSGGLSAGWQLFADSSAGFRERYGERPPWEACCVAHDRIYWQGETADGYARRQQADAQLRTCVIEEGEKQAQELAPTMRKDPQEVRQLFRRAAELMYVAVRIGGGPCSGLPWRWGYGWPQCGLGGREPDTDPAPNQPAANR